MRTEETHSEFRATYGVIGSKEVLSRMAIFHSTAKICSTSAKAKIDYISRQKKYSHSSKAEDLVHYEEHNLPDWAKNAREFFAEMDKQELSKEEKEYQSLSIQERKEKDIELKNKGETLKRKVKCREIEFALPVELESQDEMVKFAQEYCKEILGDNHVYAFAIHQNEGAISGNKNPHVHLVYSDRIIEHDREVAKEDFCRQRTGYKKDMAIVGKDRSKWIEKNREILADKINEVLKEKELKQRVSHKSYKERGIELKPTFHLGHDVIGQLKNERIEINKSNKYQRYKTIVIERMKWHEKKEITKKTKPKRIPFGQRMKAVFELATTPIYDWHSEEQRSKYIKDKKTLISGNSTEIKQIKKGINQSWSEWQKKYFAKIEQNLTSDDSGRYRTYNKCQSEEYDRRIEIERQERIRKEEEQKRKQRELELAKEREKEEQKRRQEWKEMKEAYERSQANRKDSIVKISKPKENSKGMSR